MPDHASTVALVLKPNTGSITPQYHVVFDDWFATIATHVEDLPDFNAEEWACMFGTSVHQYPLDEDALCAIAEQEVVDSEAPPPLRERVAEAMNRVAPTQPLAAPAPTAPVQQVEPVSVVPVAPTA